MIARSEAPFSFQRHFVNAQALNRYVDMIVLEHRSEYPVSVKYIDWNTILSRQLILNRSSVLVAGVLICDEIDSFVARSGDTGDIRTNLSFPIFLCAECKRPVLIASLGVDADPSLAYFGRYRDGLTVSLAVAPASWARLRPEIGTYFLFGKSSAEVREFGFLVSACESLKVIVEDFLGKMRSSKRL
jgi:hypothetical protein